MAIDPRKTLLENLEALMQRQWGAVNKRALAQKAHVGETTVHQIFGGDNRTRLDVIERLAQVFKLPAWRLLKPGVLESNQAALSDTALDIGAMFDRLPAEKQPRAYALIVQLLEFENEGPGTGDTSPPSLTPSPKPPQVHRGKSRERTPR